MSTDTTVSPLRQRMIEDMRARKLGPPAARRRCCIGFQDSDYISRHWLSARRRKFGFVGITVWRRMLSLSSVPTRFEHVLKQLDGCHGVRGINCWGRPSSQGR